MSRNSWVHFLLAVMLAASWARHTDAAVKLVERAPDPHGSPRPFRNARDVAVGTSIYFELAAASAKEAEAAAGRVRASLQAAGEGTVELLQPGRRFAPGMAGWVRTFGKSVYVYVEPGRLKPTTRYAVRVFDGDTDLGSWNFTTGQGPSVHAIEYRLDLRGKPVRWHGQFFRGICNVIFCTQAKQYGPTYDLMARTHALYPRAWTLQRDFWLTGTEDRPPGGFFPSNLPNIVRERQTRRITAVTPAPRGVVLRVEDFFGHEQYGIPTGRPVADDYHAGDEVLIADGIHDAKAKVLAVDGAAGTVTVGPIATPAGGWKIAYDGKLPTREDPDAPGLFPLGGCYLRKYDPPGDACYYWGRLDKEWDIARRQGRMVLPNFADAPGDLSRDGKSWTTVKDYAQWHEVVRAIAGHVIDRYGKDSLGFVWSIFNEPDLGGLFWRASFDDLQTYYDYTTDAILRAFEDRGYDSSKVFIGGLELGAIFGTNFVDLKPFLAHCSPTAHLPGALDRNAAMADPRLDGKRSRRVESLCRAHHGKGSPCDFISIHSYNRSELMAAKLVRAKEIALEVDPDYYRRLWIDSHESCPDWMPPPDEAARDSYLGDGYFPTWCLDVAGRQLEKAAADERFAYGQTILTVWPPPADFAGLNAVTRVIHFRGDDGSERTMTVPMPIFHVLTLLSDLGDRYWVLPRRTVGADVIDGFASRDSRGTLRILLYAHDAQDTQSRGEASFDVKLDANGLGFSGPAQLREYRFDRDHNSPFRLIESLLKSRRGTPPSLAPTVYTSAQAEQIRNVCRCEASDSVQSVGADGRLQLSVPLEGNGCAFLAIEPKLTGQ